MDYGTHESVQFRKDKCLSVATILKCLQLLCGIVTAACAGTALTCKTTAEESETASYSSVEAFGQGWVIFVGSVCIICTFCLWITDLCNIRGIYKSTKWTKAEFVYTVVAAVLYLMAFGVETWYAAAGGWRPPSSKYRGCYYGTWEASAAFAFFSLLLYIAGSVHVWLNREG